MRRNYQAILAKPVINYKNASGFFMIGAMLYLKLERSGATEKFQESRD